MNLFFGGSIGSLMKPHFYRKISPVNILRNMIRQNVLWAASRAEVLQYDIVQRQISQFHEHNWEEQDSLFTRPTLDLYIMNKYWILKLLYIVRNSILNEFAIIFNWNFITKNISEEEVADLENAKKVLENYENLYTVFEYGADLSGLMTTLETRIAHNNPSVPMTIYRKSGHNTPQKIFEEMELVLQAYQIYKTS